MWTTDPLGLCADAHERSHALLCLRVHIKDQLLITSENSIYIKNDPGWEDRIVLKEGSYGFEIETLQVRDEDHRMRVAH